MRPPTCYPPKVKHVFDYTGSNRCCLALLRGLFLIKMDMKVEQISHLLGTGNSGRSLRHRPFTQIILRICWSMRESISIEIQNAEPRIHIKETTAILNICRFPSFSSSKMCYFDSNFKAFPRNIISISCLLNSCGRVAFMSPVKETAAE